MKKQKNYPSTSLYKQLFILIIVLCSCPTLFAQVDYWNRINDFWQQEAVDDAKNGKRSLPMLNNSKSYLVTYTGAAVDLIIPDQVKYGYLELEVRGADGGNRVNKALITPFKTKGGGGAVVTGILKIGNGENEVPPGATVRMIIGKKGPTKTTYEVEGASGGGGTGLFVQKPGVKTWHTIMVAGGGGGAFSDCCSSHSNGRSASIKTSGRDGGGADGGKAGTNGDDGKGSFSGGEGGGINGALDNGVPVGSTHHNESRSQQDFFGCGHGGYGNGTGGGGGGYSGGGGGGASASGGGGGSYANTSWLHFGYIYSLPQTNSPQAGQIVFRLTDDITQYQAIKLASATQKCIDNADGALTNGNNIQLWDCAENNARQSWLINDYVIKLANFQNKCMDVKDHQTSNGTNVRIWDCMDHNEQRWMYDGLTKQFRSWLNFEKCLNDAYGGRTDNGTNIMLWDCRAQGGPGDQWILDGTTTVSDPAEARYIVPVKAQDLAVHSHTYTEIGSNIQLWEKVSSNDAETWYFDGLKIKMRTHKDLCIDLKNNSTANGNNAHLWNCNDKSTQKWIYDGQSQTIRSAANPNKCLEVADDNFEKRGNIHIWDCNGLMRQKFLIIE